ncbi:hypothetical protein GWI33_014536 [Rhynchophorus ferrugineus]|uniref:Uncharacterized protein n=1 Tax=Rhynchophorus ferrugineus TaxID=354439 RepID=A0A834I4C2_RHYFE|nr:hypothetical protein GWI33_014536 [Rhynchophorus ferrugineus]
MLLPYNIKYNNSPPVVPPDAVRARVAAPPLLAAERGVPTPSSVPAAHSSTPRPTRINSRGYFAHKGVQCSNACTNAKAGRPTFHILRHLLQEIYLKRSDSQDEIPCEIC